jgi:hypothetical protein
MFRSSLIRISLYSSSFALVLGACGAKSGDSNTDTNDEEGNPESSDDGDENDEEAQPESSDSGSVSMTTDTPDTDDTSPSDTTGDEDTTGGPVGFIMQPDGGGIAVECDVWAQDCPPGEKCMPWANDGGNAWNATRCSPVDDNPGQVGDECSVEGSGVSGIDSCDIDMMCYYVDAETNLGQCVEFCQGSEANPICDPGFVCTIANDGVLTLCRPECDPLLQDCLEIAACLPAAGSEFFTCIIDASGEAGAPGDVCEFINACDPGSFCAEAAAVPDCQGSGCCSEFCDLTAEDPNSFCSLGNGSECIAWYAEGDAPPGYDHVGACSLPL